MSDFSYILIHFMDIVYGTYNAILRGTIELSGECRTERYNGLLDPEAVDLCMKRTKKLMQSLTLYLADVTKDSVTFSEFIKWMSNSKCFL